MLTGRREEIPPRRRILRGLSFGALRAQKARVKRSAKSEYTAAEVAGELGMSLSELRTMIRKHILHPGETPRSLAGAAFQPSDIAILRVLWTGRRKLASGSQP